MMTPTRAKPVVIGVKLPIVQEFLTSGHYIGGKRLGKRTGSCMLTQSPGDSTRLRGSGIEQACQEWGEDIFVEDRRP
jgi:hypothetical protein